MRSFRRNSVFLAKLLCAVFILTFYFFYSKLNPPALTKGQPLPKRPSIQYEFYRSNNTGKAEEHRRDQIKKAMQHTYAGYKKAAWGYDDVKPMSGGYKNSRNGWGAFIVDSASTLAVMGMWDDLMLDINYIINEIDFTKSDEMVDPFETTIRYLGGLVSLVELTDAGFIPNTVMTEEKRIAVVNQAVRLANQLMLAFDVHTGLPWPKVEFGTGQVHPKFGTSIGPARAGSNFLELCTLSKLTGNVEYCTAATRSWALLVHNRYMEEIPGLVDSKISVVSGDPVGKERHWDAGHDSYYEYLLKASLLLPDSPNSKVYSDRWLEAVDALQNNLTSRSAYSEQHLMSHVYLGKWSGVWYMNEMSHLACFAPGNLIYGGRHLQKPELVVLGKVILEGCRNTYASSPTGLGPEKFSWLPAPTERKYAFSPVVERQTSEFDKYGFWTSDPMFKLRPEYVESLFYAFRATGEQRYRDWGWEVFESLEKYCRTGYGYTTLADVMVADDELVEHIDEAESYFAGETLKYLYLLFDDASTVSLDDWIFTTEAHLLKRNR